MNVEGPRGDAAASSHELFTRLFAALENCAPPARHDASTQGVVEGRYLQKGAADEEASTTSSSRPDEHLVDLLQFHRHTRLAHHAHHALSGVSGVEGAGRVRDERDERDDCGATTPRGLPRSSPHPAAARVHDGSPRHGGRGYAVTAARPRARSAATGASPQTTQRAPVSHNTFFFWLMLLHDPESELLLKEHAVRCDDADDPSNDGKRRGCSDDIKHPHRKPLLFLSEKKQQQQVVDAFKERVFDELSRRPDFLDSVDLRASAGSSLLLSSTLRRNNNALAAARESALKAMHAYDFDRCMHRPVIELLMTHLGSRLVLSRPTAADDTDGGGIEVFGAHRSPSDGAGGVVRLRFGPDGRLWADDTPCK